MSRIACVEHACSRSLSFRGNKLQLPDLKGWAAAIWGYLLRRWHLPSIICPKKLPTFVDFGIWVKKKLTFESLVEADSNGFRIRESEEDRNMKESKCI